MAALVLLIVAAPSGQVRATGLDAPRLFAARVAGDGKRTRFIADLSRAVAFSVYVEADPYRVFVDLPDIEFRLPKGAGGAAMGLVTGFRYGRLGKGRARIVIDVSAPVLISRSFALRARDGQPARMVLDLVATDKTTFSKLKLIEDQTRLAAAKSDDGGGVAEDQPPLTPSTGDGGGDAIARLLQGDPVAFPSPRTRPRATDKTNDDNADETSRQAKPVIVIDAGHGGMDPGALSRDRKTKEKDLTLAFARALRKQILARGRYRVVMTRDDDRFITLTRRVEIARAAKADLFIAIHADAIRHRGVSGATVYTLSEDASDDEAAALARRENRADIIDGVDLGRTNEEISGILIDLTMRETKNHSVFFAKKVVAKMRQATRLHRRPLRSAGFRVLKAPDVPSVLVELGYISSASDIASLKSDKWRRRVSRAIANAVDSYFSTRVALGR